MLLVSDFLEQSAESRPDKVALVYEDRRLTYAEVEAEANRLAHALKDHGVARGDRVVLFLPNSVELVIGIFATLKADGVSVAINSSTKPDKLAHLIHNCGATVLLTSDRQANVATQMLQRAPSLRAAFVVGSNSDPATSRTPPLISVESMVARYPASRPPRQCIDQDLAFLIYTSGSSGEPKGVMSTHANVVFASWSITTYLENVPEDVIICALPLSFDYGLYQLMMAFRLGGTLVLEKSFAYPAHFVERMQAEHVTGCPIVPTMLALLLNMDLSPYDLSHLRYISNTGAALPPSHIQRFRDLFPGVSVYSMYGLTETKRTLYLPPDQLDDRPGSVGVAIPGTEVWLVDEEGRRLGPNQVGELVVRGQHVMRGYWQNPEATAKRFRAGPIPGERVCYSGDLLRMDQDGYFYFVGRQDDVIKSRGEKVAPKEVEDVLYGLPGIVEAAVVGVHDPVLGQAIKAIVVTQDKAMTEKSVLRHCRAHLEDFMVPKTVEFVDSLPRTTSGKIHRSAVARREASATAT